MRIVSSRFWKLAVRAPDTDRFRSTLLPRSRLNVGPPVQLWPLLSVTVVRQRRRDGCVPLWAEGPVRAPWCSAAAIAASVWAES